VDFFLELIVSAVVQFVVEVLGELLLDTALQGLASVLQSRLGRWSIATALGLGFGVFWGVHLSGQDSWPRLLWVSLVFAALAFMLAVRPAAAGGANDVRSWQDLLMPPWRWSGERLLGLGVLNIALAAGIVAGFRGGHG
jgi:hypothetical protein